MADTMVDTMTSATGENAVEDDLKEMAMISTNTTGQDIIHCSYCGSPRIILVLRDRSNGPCGGSVQLINPDICYEYGDDEFPTIYETHCRNCHFWNVIHGAEDEQ